MHRGTNREGHWQTAPDEDRHEGVQHQWAQAGNQELVLNQSRGTGEEHRAGHRTSSAFLGKELHWRCWGLVGSAGNYAQKSQRKEGLFCGSYGSYLQQQRPRAMQSRGWRASEHVGNSSQAQGKLEAEDKAPPVRAGVLSGQLFSNRWIHTGEKQVKHGVAFNQKHCAHLLSFEKPNRNTFMSHFRLSKPTYQDHLPQQKSSRNLQRRMKQHSCVWTYWKNLDELQIRIYSRLSLRQPRILTLFHNDWKIFYFVAVTKTKRSTCST